MTTLHHLRAGSGEPLVLIHGLGSDLRAWLPVIAPLAAEREVIAIDLPGFGRSAPLRERPTVAALARAVAAFLDAQRLGHPHLGGNALGGWIALELSRLGCARSVTALSPAGFWTAAGCAWARASLRASARLARALARASPTLLRPPLARAVLLGQMFGHPSRIPPSKAVAAVHSFADAPGLDATIEATLSREGFRAFETPPAIPITIAWGLRDRLFPAAQARRAAARVPGARMVALEGCGHVPTWDDPTAVVRVLLAGSGGPRAQAA